MSNDNPYASPYAFTVTKIDEECRLVGFFALAGETHASKA